MKNILIKCNNLCKTYKTDSTDVSVINNLTTEIYEEDFTVIMGNSGSGKSTFLYMISGLDSVTNGEILFEESRIDNVKENKMVNFRREKIGFVFQSINLVPNLNVLENVAVPGFLVKGDKKQVIKKAEELLESVELKNEIKRLPSRISGGQQQRVAIARGLINSPKVLFADEPTGALNSVQGENVLDLLTKINDKGQSIIMVTHDIKAACRANRILFLKDGTIDGVLELPKYTKENSSTREEEIFNFIKKRGW